MHLGLVFPIPSQKKSNIASEVFHACVQTALRGLPTSTFLLPESSTGWAKPTTSQRAGCSSSLWRRGAPHAKFAETCLLVVTICRYGWRVVGRKLLVHAALEEYTSCWFREPHGTCIFSAHIYFLNYIWTLVVFFPVAMSLLAWMDVELWLGQNSQFYHSTPGKNHKFVWRKSVIERLESKACKILLEPRPCCPQVQHCPLRSWWLGLPKENQNWDFLKLMTEYVNFFGRISMQCSTC